MDKDKLLSFSDKVSALAREITACSYCGTIMGDSRGHKCGECGESNALVNLEEAIDTIISLRFRLADQGVTRYERVEANEVLDDSEYVDFRNWDSETDPEY